MAIETKLTSINKILKQVGIEVLKTKELVLQKTYIEFLENISLNSSSENGLYPDKETEVDVNFIIFSKDRAIQLFALLKSFYTNVSLPGSIHVLYHASNLQHEHAYKQVIELFSGYDIFFVKENNFRFDLLNIVNSLIVSKVIFLVDDIIFTEPLELKEFINIDTQRFVASLRLGDHLNFSYTMQQPQPLPAFIKKEGIEYQDKIIWEWHKGAFDWNYPLSVDGHLFSVHEIKCMLPLLDFKAPNSLEEAMQLFKPLYLKRLGIAYKKAKIVNVPCNKVQDENDNISEEVTVEFLLEKWQNGYQIDYAKFLHFKNISAHQYIPFAFTLRSDYTSKKV